ncbi:MAG: ribosome assembly RNA-binding protein YhbY [Legionella sp.]
MDTSFRQSLKAQAHHLKPTILLGAKGLTEAVVAETHIALQTHELIKVKINGAEKEDRLVMAHDLCQQLEAELVQMIGSTAIIYRKNKEQVKKETKAPIKKSQKDVKRRR